MKKLPERRTEDGNLMMQDKAENRGFVLGLVGAALIGVGLGNLVYTFYIKPLQQETEVLTEENTQLRERVQSLVDTMNARTMNFNHRAEKSHTLLSEMEEELGNIHDHSLYTRAFQWGGYVNDEFAGLNVLQTRSFELDVPSEIYFGYRKRTHRVEEIRASSYTSFVTVDDVITATVKEICGGVLPEAPVQTKPGYSGKIVYDREKRNWEARVLRDVSNLTRFAQSVAQYDIGIEQDRDYVRYPVETLVEGNFDCEDGSILVAALLKAYGVDTGLIYIYQNGNRSAHMMAAVSHPALDIMSDKWFIQGPHGKRYLCIETTRRDFRLGEMADMYRDYHKELALIR